MKAIDDMTEPELRKLTTSALNALRSVLPKGTGFAVVFAPYSDRGYGIGQYGSNVHRPDMIKMLRDCADRIESNLDVRRD
jgi:hypothetical protein